MKIVVMKFGGTSVGDVEKINNVSKIISNNYTKHKIIVVLSAMAGVTNNLQKLINEISTKQTPENGENHNIHIMT